MNPVEWLIYAAAYDYVYVSPMRKFRFKVYDAAWSAMEQAACISNADVSLLFPPTPKAPSLKA